MLAYWRRLKRYLQALWGLTLALISYLRREKPDRVTTQWRVIRYWKVFGAVLFIVWFYFWSVSVNFLWLFGKSPDLENQQRPRLELASEVYTADGVLVGKYFRENRTPVGYRDISPWLIKALLATEDIRFTDHSGIDPGATLSIFVYLAKGDNRGGSTITQQLAKNLYKIRKRESRGLMSYVPGVNILISKTKEWLTAVQLERLYTKQEILTLYLNTVDFGSNSFGIKTAAANFFDKHPSRLTPDEAAILVGMLKATTTYNPRKNYAKALKRRNTVLEQMTKYNFLSQGLAKELSQKPIILVNNDESYPDGPMDYYNSYLTNTLKDWMDEEGQKSEEEGSMPPDIYADGLKIYLTIDSRMQSHAQLAMRQHMRELQKRFDGHWYGKNPWADDKGNELPNFIENLMARSDLYKSLVKQHKGNTTKVWEVLNTPKKMVLFNWKKPEGDTVELSPMDSLRYCKRLLHPGMMTIEGGTGHIKAWVGGLDYRYFKYDHVKQSKRQAGSTFKAFVYAAAMKNGFGPCYRVQDRAFTYKYKEEIPGRGVIDTFWTPTNATGYYSGINMTLRFGMGRSVNSIAAQVTQLVGGPKVVADMAKSMGIKSQLKELPSIGLGANDVSLFEMVGAFGTFINSGEHTTPVIVGRVEDHSGRIIKTFQTRRTKVLNQEAAFLMLHMLKGTVEEPGGTAQALFSFDFYRRSLYSRNEMGGKTGTSQNQSDGWFIGVTPNHVTGVWVGADERSIHFRTLRAGEGSKTALPMYGRYMEMVFADRSLGIKPDNFPKPKIKIKTQYLCRTVIPKKDTSSAPVPAEEEPDATLESETITE